MWRSDMKDTDGFPSLYTETLIKGTEKEEGEAEIRAAYFDDGYQKELVDINISTT